MKFVLEVNLDGLTADGAAVYDSAYRVGHWSVTDASDVQR